MNTVAANDSKTCILMSAFAPYSAMPAVLDPFCSSKKVFGRDAYRRHIP